MTNERLQSHYDDKYRNEADARPTNELVPLTSVPTSRFEAIVRNFPAYFAGGDVLELGAGDGLIARSLLHSLDGLRSYTVSDISRPRLEGLKRSLADPRVSILELDAEHVPETIDHRYDAIIMVALIEHLVDPMGAMQRIGNLLKPGGFVYIDTPNVAKYTQRLKLLFGRFPSTACADEGLAKFSGGPVDLFGEGHLHYFTYRSLSRMLVERCGYSRVVKAGYPGGRIPLGRRVHGVLADIWPEMFSELAVFAIR